MKNSEKREKILNIFNDGSLLTAHEVCLKLNDIDRATVYRNLNLFVSEGILREVNIKKGTSSYELNIQGDNHQHFVCTNCDKVIPVEVNQYLLNTLIPTDIKVENFELNLKGKCNECK